MKFRAGLVTYEPGLLNKKVGGPAWKKLVKKAVKDLAKARKKRRKNG